MYIFPRACACSREKNVLTIYTLYTYTCTYIIICIYFPPHIPSLFSPQHLSEPSSSTAQVWCCPQPIRVAVLPVPRSTRSRSSPMSSVERPLEIWSPMPSCPDGSHKLYKSEEHLEKTRTRRWLLSFSTSIVGYTPQQKSPPPTPPPPPSLEKGNPRKLIKTVGCFSSLLSTTASHTNLHTISYGGFRYPCKPPHVPRNRRGHAWLGTRTGVRSCPQL